MQGRSRFILRIHRVLRRQGLSRFYQVVLAVLLAPLGTRSLLAQSGYEQHIFAEAPPDSAPTSTGRLPAEPDCDCISPNVGIAVIEVAAINVLSIVFNRFYFEDRGLAVSPESWVRNLERGWEFDDNPFTTNQLEHPSAGSLYFNAGRSNGFGFWEAVPLTALGSWMFEYFGESNRPSFSDFMTTTLGGVSLGEAAYRLSSLVLDNQATGASRVLREIGGTLLNPVRGFNRLASGQMTRTGINHFDRTPGRLSINLDVGAQQFTRGQKLEHGVARSYVQLELDYGEPLAENVRRPFQTFRLVVQHEPSSGRLFDQLRILGNLYGSDVRGGASGRHRFMVGLDYLYMFNGGYKFGHHSVPLGLVSRWRLSDQWVARTRATASAVLLGAVESGYHGRREGYEYGPGLGVGFRASLLYRGFRVVDLGHEMVWIHTISGAMPDHLVQVGMARLGWRLLGNIGLGLDGYLYQLNSYREGDRGLSRTRPEARAYLTLVLD